MVTEDLNKSFQFLDLNIINNKSGRYEFEIHRKNAITNVQVKRNSGHDVKILRGRFTGFLNRTYIVCEEEHLKEEIDFLINCFVGNGYEKRQL